MQDPKRNSIFLTILLLALTLACSQKKEQNIDLSGEWHFQIDSLNVGITEQWFNKQLNEVISLPGSMAENGKGDDISIKTYWTGGVQNRSWYTEDKYEKYREPGNIKIPFWLQPNKKYYGAAWYQKEITIPQNWKRQKITLYLERCHWETKLWVDNQFVGMQNSLGTAHAYDISSYLQPGKHRISICIDNRIKKINPGINSHSITDHTQSNWNGITGAICLKAQPLIALKDVSIFPDIKHQKALVKLSVNNIRGIASDCTIEIVALCHDGTNNHMPDKVKMEYSLEKGINEIEIEYPLGKDMLLWDEFHPNVYNMTVKLKSNSGTDSKQIPFGMRSFEVDGTQFAVNGRPVFLRGTLECAIFPKTGYPSMDEKEWVRICKVIKSHGLNHIRFHSWCPPEAAFLAADKTGIYLQVECSSWANQGSTIGDGKPIDKWLYKESEAIVKAYGNHPSFCMMAYGNEPAGRNLSKYLDQFIKYWKKKDLRRVYTGGAGWPFIDENDYHNSPAPRIQGWGEQLKSIINAESPKSDYDWSSRISNWNKPVVSHEIGQWCVYPNFKEIDKYTGVLKAKNFEIFKETLGNNHMEHLADSFLLASGKLQALCYKADIEAALRTKDFAGFQLLDLHDFPGQGTALVGVLDPFWEEKGYISPEQFSRFCNTTVPLARLPKRVFAGNELFTADIEVAHYGEHDLISVVPYWQIANHNGKILYSGKLKETDLHTGNGQKLGALNISIEKVVTPEQLTLSVHVNKFINSWDFWVYPETTDQIDNTFKVVPELDDETLHYLEGGGKVILTMRKGALKSEYGGDIGIGFSSIFWNTAWTGGQKPHTLGILCNPDHPALAAFPTEYHSNWQWWDAMSHSHAIILDRFSPKLKPIVRVIDDWVTNRRLALIFEAKIGKGKLIISGIDLVNELENRPEARQLLYSLKKYVTSGQFSPTVEMNKNEIIKMFN